MLSPASANSLTSRPVVYWPQPASALAALPTRRGASGSWLVHNAHKPVQISRISTQ